VFFFYGAPRLFTVLGLGAPGNFLKIQSFNFFGLNKNRFSGLNNKVYAQGSGVNQGDGFSVPRPPQRAPAGG
ncbi:hypothetical protein ACVGXO_00310, partial [Enterobacter hormaechei]